MKKISSYKGGAFPVTLAFLFFLGVLASIFFLAMASEGLSSANQMRGVQQELLERSALEHFRAAFLAARQNGTPFWPCPGATKPFMVNDSQGNCLGYYALELDFAKPNFSYERFWNGAAWEAKEGLACASLDELASALSRESGHLTQTKNALEAALILSDSCDENQAIRERGALSGIECINFKEILCDDRSQIRFCYRASDVYEKERSLCSLPYFFGNRNYDENLPLAEDTPALRETFQASAARRIITEECRLTKNYVVLKLENEPLSTSDNDRFLKEWQKRMGGIFIKEGVWRKAQIALFGYAAPNLTPKVVTEIKDSSKNELFLTRDLNLWCAITNYSLRFAQLRGWVHSETLYAESEKLPLWLGAMGLGSEKYYEVFLQDSNFPAPAKDKNFGLSRSNTLIASGEISGGEAQNYQNYSLPYANGLLQKSDGLGTLQIVLQSPKGTSPKARARINSIYFRRPDIIAAWNASQEPIFLANWSLRASVGEEAQTLGFLPYEARLEPGERFFLSDCPEIVKEEYGLQNSSDTSQKGQEPVFALPKSSFGLEYEISNLREIKEGPERHTIIGCRNALWRRDELLGEIVEIITKNSSERNDALSPNGLRFPIEGGNTKETIKFSNLLLETYGQIKKGDRLKIVGIPRQLEYAALSLRDEYGQLAARAGFAKEKRKEDNPHSHLFEKGKWHLSEKPFCKKEKFPTLPFLDQPITNFANAQKAFFTAQEFNPAPGAKKLFSESSSLSYELLEFPLYKAKHQGGWQKAFGRASRELTGLVLEDANFLENFFQGERLRILDGPMKGESFVITQNFGRTVKILERSLKKQKPFPREKTFVALGPGYRFPFYFANKDNETGVFTFSNCFAAAHGKLYLSGHCDSIFTTEFLEENHNAEITVRIFNWEAQKFDEKIKGRLTKNDKLFLTTLKNNQLSPSGLITLEISASGFNHPKNSGRALINALVVVPAQRKSKEDFSLVPSPFFPLLGFLKNPLQKIRPTLPGALFRLKISFWGKDTVNPRESPPEAKRELLLTVPDPIREENLKFQPAFF